MTRTFIDISVLQSVPPSNINRDDTGSPKTAMYGGARRARVSSQAWKRAARVAFNDELDASKVGTRTKRVVELVAERIRAHDSSLEDRSVELATAVCKAAGFVLDVPRGKVADDAVLETKFLMFLSNAQIDALARAATAAAGEDDLEAALKTAGVKGSVDQDHSVDIALFGRMVADQTDLNVDAAVQVAHAISTHPVELEYDYFTAVDDHKQADDEEDAGAAMIGTVEFNSSTLYRYATIDLEHLHRNLGDRAAEREAVEVFVRAFITSMPTGKQNTFANRTLPDAVYVAVRESQPVNLVGAFERPVTGALVEQSATRLATHAAHIDEVFGTTPVASWVVRVGDHTRALDALAAPVSLDALIEGLGRLVEERAGQES